jgi:hypothetical protein
MTFHPFKRAGGRLLTEIFLPNLLATGRQQGMLALFTGLNNSVSLKEERIY